MVKIKIVQEIINMIKKSRSVISITVLVTKVLKYQIFKFYRLKMSNGLKSSKCGFLVKIGLHIYTKGTNPEPKILNHTNFKR